MNRRRAVEVLKAIVRETREENVTFMAGSIAYHAFVSLLPLLVLVLFVLQSVGDEGLTTVVLGVVEGAFTEGGRRLILDTVEGGVRVSGVSVLGLAVLVWATLRIFRSLDQAFSDIYETESANSFLDQVGDGAVVFLAVAGAVVATALVRTVLVFGTGPVGWVLQTGFVVAALTGALLPLYYVFPDADIRVVEALPGTLVAAVGVTGLESLFRVYVSLSTTAESYGVVGGIVVLVTWLYFNGLVILLGAVVNAVVTNRTADVVIEPVLGNYRVGLGPGPDGPDSEDSPGPGAELRELREWIGAETSVTVTVGDETVSLPPPTAVDVGTDGDGERISLRW